MRRTVLIPALCLLAAFALSACSPAAPGDQASALWALARRHFSMT